MTDWVIGPGIRAAAPLRPLAALIHQVPQRLRERAFWVIQAGVFAVTALHISGEWWFDRLAVGTHPALHHVPVILYLAPIAYASLRYGIEGAALTGVWSALLTLPNVVVWHPANLEWLTELVYVGLVLGAGIVMAVPVERERRQRRRAESTSRQLRLLNDIATLTLTADLDRTLQQTLATLTDVLPVDAACLAVADPATPQRHSVLARHPPQAGGDDPLGPCLERLVGAGEARSGGDDVHTVPFDTDLPDPGPNGRVTGLLAVQARSGTALSRGDHQLLAAVANQLAIALANTRLTELERDRVRSYARLVTWAQEEERKRISRELHDEAAQNLVAIRRGIEAAARDHARGPIVDLERLHALTSHTLADLRRFSHDLRPPVLDDLGLASAVESLVADTRARSDLAIDLAVTGTPRRLASETELALFRIAQSALHNTERHAGAAHATVGLSFHPGRVRLAVCDDGCGFHPPDDVADLVDTGKLGLVGMHERAQLVGGSLAITSAPGAGTRVEVAVAQ